LPDIFFPRRDEFLPERAVTWEDGGSHQRGDKGMHHPVEDAAEEFGKIAL
jgi:hypothetical protein